MSLELDRLGHCASLRFHCDFVAFRADRHSMNSHALGARVQAVSLPIPEAAIDVDRESDLALVTRIVRERESGAAGQSGRTPSDRKPPLSGS